MDKQDQPEERHCAGQEDHREVISGGCGTLYVWPGRHGVLVFRSVGGRESLRGIGIIQR